jgi:hypothetical protein
MVRPRDLYCPSRFLWPREIISSKFIDNLGARPQKGSPALHYSIEVKNEWNYPFTHPSRMPVWSAQGNFTLNFTLSNQFKFFNKLHVHRYNIGLWPTGTDSFFFIIVGICDTPYLNHLPWWSKALNRDHQQSTRHISVLYDSHSEQIMSPYAAVTSVSS